jgi:hypothetical protein
MRRIGVAAWVAFAALAGVPACTRTVAAHAAPAARVLHDEGVPVEVTLLAVYPGTAKEPGGEQRVRWVQLALRNPDRNRTVQVRRPHVAFVDAAGKADDEMFSNLINRFPEVADADHPQFNGVMSLGPAAVEVAEIAFLPGGSAAAPRTVRARMDDSTDWPLDGVPAAPVEQRVPVPAAAVPLGRSVTLAGTGADAHNGKLVDSRLTMTVLTEQDARPPEEYAHGFGAVALTVRLTNTGRHPFWMLAGLAMVAFDTVGRPVRTIPVDGSRDFSIGELIPPGATRTAEVGLLVPVRATLSHVQFALDKGGASAVGWWRLP